MQIMGICQASERIYLDIQIADILYQQRKLEHFT